MVGNNESKQSKQHHEIGDDEQIAKRYNKGRYPVMQQRATTAATALMGLLHGIAAIAINAKKKNEDATKHLKIELCVRIIYKIYHKAHADTCKHCIYQIAESCTHTRYKPKPTPLFQRSVDAQNTNWSHRSRGQYPYQNTLYDEF